MTDQPFLQAVGVSKVYGINKASGIKNTDVSITPGRITAIIGESGSGKSTLLKLFYGLLSPDSGKVLFKGERIWGPAEKLIPGHDAMKMVTQSSDDLNLFAKVWDNVATMLPHSDLKSKQENTDLMLKQLKLDAHAGKQVVNLSGGEKQRVAIARALITGPDILLLDEPFNQVDTSFREGLQRDIREIVKATGLTVIIVSHDPAEVLSMADELLVLKDGEIVESGSPKALYLNPANLYTARLLANCTVLTRREAETLDLFAGREQVVIYPAWIQILKSKTNSKWTVKEVLFKGCYEDLLVEYKGINLRVLNDQFGKFTEGSKINLKLNKWLEY